MATNKAIVVVGIERRRDMLDNFIRSYRDCFLQKKDIDLIVFYQGETPIEGHDGELIVMSKDMGGNSPARIASFEAVPEKYDYVIVADDDMELKPQTDFLTLCEILEKNQNVATVVGRFARSESQFMKMVANDRPKTVKALDCSNVRGGLAVRRKDLQEIIDNEEYRNPTVYDIYWTRFYINGYLNLEYNASVCVHRSCEKRGIRVGINSIKMRNPDKEWYKEPIILGNGSEQCFWDGDTNLYARELHERNKKCP